jgi:glutathione S-transferase
MIVYGSSLSPFVRKVLAFTGEKGLVVDHRPVRPRDPSPDFQACSALGKIPAFSDGDYRLADSTAICHYVERKYPAPALFPDDAEAYGRMVWFDKYADTILIPVMGKVFFNLVVKAKLLGQEPDMAVVEKALAEELPPIFDYLDSQATGPFLVGVALSLADVAIAAPFVNLKIAGHPPDASRWPRLGAYVSGILSRPRISKIRD